MRGIVLGIHRIVALLHYGIHRVFVRAPQRDTGEWVQNPAGEHVFLPRHFSDLNLDELAGLGIGPSMGGGDAVSLRPAPWSHFAARTRRLRSR